VKNGSIASSTAGSSGEAAALSRLIVFIFTPSFLFSETNH
jgi:hypothetical protein